MSESPARKILIVGASAAGLRCASRLARLKPGWRITVVERRPVFSWAACGLPYFVSGDLVSADPLLRSGDGLLRDAAYFSSVKGVDVLAGWTAAGLDAEKRTLAIRKDGEERALAWDECVIATGARARKLRGQPDDPRVMACHTLDDARGLRSRLETGKVGTAAVIGAGSIGCEMAEAFRSMWGAEVILFEKESWPLPQILDQECGAVVAHALRRNGVTLCFGRAIETIEPSPAAVTIVAGGERQAADLVVVAVGVEPEIELARAAGALVGPTGALAVDDRLATSLPHVWAAGDCVESRSAVTGAACHVPLGSIANRQGRTLAHVLAGLDDRFPAVAGAAAVKVFDVNVAATGITRAAADARGLSSATVWVSGYDRAHYWPEAKDVFLQLLYDRASGRILGVQAVGDGECAKRIDVATQHVARGGTISGLASLEHAYAPPYAPAIDPLALAAWCAENQRAGIVAVSPATAPNGAAVLDVRHADERDERPFAASHLTAIPLEELRGQAATLPDEPWLVVCERGGRSQEAVRILVSREIRSAYLAGGRQWRVAAGWEE